MAVKPKGVLSNVFVQLEPGPAQNATLGNHPFFNFDQTQSPVNLDELSNVFTPDVRNSIRTQLQQGVLAFGGAGATDLNQTIYHANPLTLDAIPVTDVLATRSPQLDALNFEFNTVSGDLRAGPIGGNAQLNAVSGDAVLERVGGRLRANAVSGGVTVREASGAVKVESVSGDVQLDSVAAGDVELNSISGDLHVGIKRGSRVGVDATAVSGDLDSDIELGSGEDTAADDGPLVELRARTISGDLRISRA